MPQLIVQLVWMKDGMVLEVDTNALDVQQVHINLVIIKIVVFLVTLHVLQDKNLIILVQ
jgi:hypothetical protein